MVNFKFMIPCNRLVAKGVRHTTPKLPKGPLLATKWTKNGAFVGGSRGEVQKVHFLVLKVHFCGFLTSPKLILAMGLPHKTLFAVMSAI